MHLAEQVSYGGCHAPDPRAEAASPSAASQQAGGVPEQYDRLIGGSRTIQSRFRVQSLRRAKRF